MHLLAADDDVCFPQLDGSPVASDDIYSRLKTISAGPLGLRMCVPCQTAGYLHTNAGKPA